MGRLYWGNGIDVGVGHAATDRAARYGMWFAGGLYLLVQAPTIRFRIPLNNAVQALDIDALDAPALAEARRTFEALGTAGTAFEPVQQSSLSLHC